MHLRLPSFDRGVTSFVWAVVLAVYVYFGMLAVGVSRPTSLVISLLCFAGIFLFVRLFGGDGPRRR